MLRLKLWQIAWVVPLAGVVFGLSGCDERNQFVPPPPPEVTVAHPVSRDVVDTVEFTGTTRATARVDLRARVNGYLQRIEFEDGQMVNKGDPLFVIDQAPFKAEVQVAEANLQKAKAGMQLAEANLARGNELFRRQVTTQQELDVLKAERASSAAEVAAAEAALKQAELNLGFTEINAPLSGRIGRHLVDVGNLVGAEQTMLATIESIDPIHAYFYVSERDLLRFMNMLRANELPDPEKNPPVLYMGLSNEKGFPHKGTLDFREFGVDPGTGTVERRGVFPNPDKSLIPGLFVRIQAPVGQPKPRVLVEERAIGSDQRGDYVLVIDGENTVQYRPVKLGTSFEGMRVIEEGLTTSERIVVNGLQRARPGAKVNPRPAVPTAEEQTAALPSNPPRKSQE